MKMQSEFGKIPMQRFDVTISPLDDFSITETVEVDAVGEEEAMEFVRTLSRGRVTVRAITPHHEHRRKQPPVSITVRIKNFVGGCLNGLSVLKI